MKILIIIFKVLIKYFYFILKNSNLEIFLKIHLIKSLNFFFYMKNIKTLQIILFKQNYI